ncbi:MAG TPA: hypothetical protein VFN68_08935 [Acidimicrobiales bacterium]|nr:hypothetical protein [Acidimicrobiales bacterium]
MTVLYLFLGLLTGLLAAARSTWSPCGLSMLSTITPFGERARGNRYRATAAWFVVGATLGGATLGAAAAGLAAVVSSSGLGGHPAALAAVAAVLAAGAAGVDAGILGEVLPLIRRQVDDGWLARYRPWVYGAGFGWQIGVGLATYLMTAGVILVALLAAATASPAAAVVVCTGFGLARGLTVFLTAGAATPARLRQMHAFLDSVGPTVRWALVGLQAAAALELALVAAGVTGAALWPAAVVVVAGAVAGGAAGRVVDRPRCARPEPAPAVSRSAVGA